MGGSIGDANSGLWGCLLNHSGYPDAGCRRSNFHADRSQRSGELIS